MIHDDTVKLLRECNAGVKMGVTSLDEMLSYVESKELKKILSASKETHEHLGNETRQLLNSYGDAGKEPNRIAKGMSWLKTNVMMTITQDDKTAADLITDGCNMGVKSLHKYLNEYKAAEEDAKQIAKQLIQSEESLTKELQAYL